MRCLRTAIMVMTVFSMVCSAGCTRTEPAVVGKWRNQAIPESVEFNRDHTGMFVVKDHPTLPFSWSMANAKAVQLEIVFQGKVQTLSGHVEAKTLILEGKGAQAVYSKVE